MNILFVSAGYPDPNGRGYQRRAAQHLASLRKIGAVTLVIPGSALDGALSEGRLPQELAVTEIIARRERTHAEVTQEAYSTARTAAARLFGALRRRYDTDQVALPRDRARYREMLADRFDMIFAFRIGSAVWLDSVLGNSKPGLAIVDFDDIESLALARNSAGNVSSRFWRFMIRRYVRRLGRIEKQLSETWLRILVCSDHDVEVLRKRKQPALAIPNAVHFPEHIPDAPHDGLHILFVGTLNYRPNVEGIVWFVREVWPAIRAHAGMSAKLTIVGFDPTQEVLALGASQGVDVQGPVDDLSTVYGACNLVIAPIFSGGGTRIKILEAFSYKRAIVTTPLGCEGLDLTPGRHAQVAQSAPEFAKAVLELANDRAASDEMARHGYEFGIARYSHKAIAAHFEKAIGTLGVA